METKQLIFWAIVFSAGWLIIIVKSLRKSKPKKSKA
jgi:hypothetical protein